MGCWFHRVAANGNSRSWIWDSELQGLLSPSIVLWPLATLGELRDVLSRIKKPQAFRPVATGVGTGGLLLRLLGHLFVLVGELVVALSGLAGPVGKLLAVAYHIMLGVGVGLIQLAHLFVVFGLGFLAAGFGAEVAGQLVVVLRGLGLGDQSLHFLGAELRLLARHLHVLHIH